MFNQQALPVGLQNVLMLCPKDRIGIGVSVGAMVAVTYAAVVVDCETDSDPAHHSLAIQIVVRAPWNDAVAYQKRTTKTQRPQGTKS
jgi:hypothetical protein